MAEAENQLSDVQKRVDVISLDESKRAIATTIEKASSELNEVATEREVTATGLKAMKRGTCRRTPTKFARPSAS